MLDVWKYSCPMAPGFQKVLDSQVTCTQVGLLHEGWWTTSSSLKSCWLGPDRLPASTRALTQRNVLRQPRKALEGWTEVGSALAAGGVRSPGYGSWQSAPLALTQAWSLLRPLPGQVPPCEGPRGSRQLHHSEKGTQSLSAPHVSPRCPTLSGSAPQSHGACDFRVGKCSASVTPEQGLACPPGARGSRAGASQGQRQSWAWTAPVPWPPPTPAVASSF